jgi:hypothetical protein
MKKTVIFLLISFMVCSVHAQWTTSGQDTYYNLTGNVGLGTMTPTEKLSVDGNVLIGQTNNYLQFVDRLTLQVTNTGSNNWTRSFIGQNIRWNPLTSKWRIDANPYSDCAMIRFEDGGAIGFYVRNNYGAAHEITDNDFNAYKRMVIDLNGNVGIGTNAPGSFKLAVEGKIGAREIKVTLTNPWPDYVFQKDYQLRSLSSLSDYIKKHNHLPGMPAAAEVEKDGGIELGQMNVKLLEKIEELTLYMIELKKENDQRKMENAHLKKEVQKLLHKK